MQLDLQQGALEAQEVYGELIQTNIKGLDGTGVRVCIVDSGIDTTHQDLAGINLVAWRDFVNNQEQPYDDQGHGTSMAGILVADGWMEGVAPKGGISGCQSTLWQWHW